VAVAAITRIPLVVVVNSSFPASENIHRSVGYTLAHDLDAAAVHAERALALDGGSAWAWGRSGFLKAYSGRAAEAIEELEIARSLAPADELNFLWSIGIASAAFQIGRYEQAVCWFRRALAENPKATWCDRYARDCVCRKRTTCALLRMRRINGQHLSSRSVLARPA
jgi:tetratricopeptide (TPR) repeat protein